MTSAPTPPSAALIAEDLLRVMLAEGGGSLPRRGLRERAGAARRLDVSLRAALFCDLVRSGHVGGMLGPVPAGSADDPYHDPDDAAARQPPSDVPQDRMLAAVFAAVQRRPRLAWRRWFRHIRDDRAVLVDRFARSGGWRAQGGNRFADADPDGAQRLHARAFALAELIEAPRDEREAVLGFLYALTGPRMPGERVLAWEARLAALDTTPGGPTLRRVLRAAQSTSRPRRLRSR